MHTFDQNQQLPHYRRRRCIAYSSNDFFEYFDFSQHQIISTFEASAQSLMVKSLAILIDNIRNSNNLQSTEPCSPKQQKYGIKKSLQSFKKNNFTFKKKMNQQEQDEQEDSTNPQRQIMELVEYEKTGKKPTKSKHQVEYCKENKVAQQNFAQAKKHQKLINSLRKLTVSEQFSDLDSGPDNFDNADNKRNSEDTNLLHFDEEVIKNKSISELLSESNAKAKKYNKQQISPIQSENSQYEMTDHSSNESSNDEGDYEERFAYQSDNTSLFGTCFGEGGKNMFLNSNPNKKLNFSTDSVHHPPKLNFKPLLDSPKKSKTKKKRLYINKKKVPRWAENRQQLTKEFGSEKQKQLRAQAHHLFGICVVEDIQTNTIFNRKDEYIRSSTVKWQREQKFVT